MDVPLIDASFIFTKPLAGSLTRVNVMWSPHHRTKKAALTHVKYQEGFFAAAMRVFYGKAPGIHLEPVSLYHNKEGIQILVQIFHVSSLLFFLHR
jgi:hypothetical protein